MEIFNLKEEIIANFNIQPFCIDSRNIQTGQIFVALQGSTANGSKFSKNAEDLGSSLIIADTKNIDVKHTRQIIVENVLEYLIKIAKYNRENLYGQEISITGSIGKTTTKDLISFLLTKKYKTSFNKGNFNNHIGLPLTIANSPSSVEFLITEMGANHIGEIAFLSQIAQPNICIITQIGHSHIGEFGSLENIAKAKAEIFLGARQNFISILNRDDIYFDFLKEKAKETNKLKKIISFGRNADSDIRLIDYSIEQNEILVRIYGRKYYRIPMQTYSTPIIESSLIALATIISINDDIEEYIKYFKEFPINNGRNNIIRTNNDNITVIDGSYNSSIESLFTSINDIKNIDTNNIHKNKFKIAFIGRIAELGIFEEEINKKIEIFLNKKLESGELDLIITIGENFLDQAQFLHFNNTEDLFDFHLQNIVEDLEKKDGSIIFIKGSNYLKMNRIVDFLYNI